MTQLSFGKMLHAKILYTYVYIYIYECIHICIYILYRYIGLWIGLFLTCTEKFMAKSSKQTASSCTGWQVWCREGSEKYWIGETRFISVATRCHMLQACLHLHHVSTTRCLRTQLRYRGCYTIWSSVQEACISCRKLPFQQCSLPEPPTW